jgi:hypothetical protein
MNTVGVSKSGPLQALKQTILKAASRYPLPMKRSRVARHFFVSRRLAVSKRSLLPMSLTELSTALRRGAEYYVVIMEHRRCAREQGNPDFYGRQ